MSNLTSKKYFYPLCVICVLILIYVIIILYTSSIVGDLLTGFWKSDKDFLQNANLTTFILYIGPDEKGRRPCYILAEENDNLAINEPASVELHEKLKDRLSLNRDKITYQANFTDLETKSFPSKQQLVLYPKVGKIVLYEKDVIYGVFYKDGVLSETVHDMKKISVDKGDFEKDVDKENNTDNPVKKNVSKDIDKEDLK